MPPARRRIRFSIALKIYHKSPSFFGLMFGLAFADEDLGKFRPEAVPLAGSLVNGWR
jgi:hypothetical protein